MEDWYEIPREPVLVDGTIFFGSPRHRLVQDDGEWRFEPDPERAREAPRTTDLRRLFQRLTPGSARTSTPPSASSAPENNDQRIQSVQANDVRTAVTRHYKPR